ncbi:MAG: hypothetical protein HOC57_03370, partial [Rhodospirillaceae bacterium]|nr:hypothetical protein [Rhodospirillaceae bacterium]
EEGSQANRFKDGIRRIEIQMEDFVGENRAQNRISTDADKRIIALLLFGVYRTEVRRWLSRSELDVDKGMERLRPYLEVVIAGLGPGKNAL